MHTFSKEFGDGYRSLTTHLRKMETTIKQIYSCKMCQKQRWESDISRKDASQLPGYLRKVSFFQNSFAHTFYWSKSISGAFDTNPVDTRRRFNVDTRSYPRWNYIVCLQGTVNYIRILIISVCYLELLSNNPHEATSFTVIINNQRKFCPQWD